MKKLQQEDVQRLLQQEHVVLSGNANNIATIRFLKERIKESEKAVLAVAKLKEDYKHLPSVPGVGMILALTIMFETGDIHRFQKVGNYASYCRCVSSTRLSNGKSKGKVTGKTATSIYPGLMWRPPTLLSVTIPMSGVTISGRWPRPITSWRQRLWLTNCHGPVFIF